MDTYQTSRVFAEGEFGFVRVEGGVGRLENLSRFAVLSGFKGRFCPD